MALENRPLSRTVASPEDVNVKQHIHDRSILGRSDHDVVSRVMHWQLLSADRQLTKNYGLYEQRISRRENARCSVLFINVVMHTKPWTLLNKCLYTFTSKLSPVMTAHVYRPMHGRNILPRVLSFLSFKRRPRRSPNGTQNQTLPHIQKWDISKWSFKIRGSLP